MTSRLTPVDILNKRFSRRISGYYAAETDEFMRQVAADMEAILVENAAQREQIAALDREMTRYRSLENTMRDALVLGQKAADEIRDAARAQAAAQLESAQQKVDLLHEQTERLRLDRRRITHEMKALLESQIAWLDYEMIRDIPPSAVGAALQTAGNEAPQMAISSSDVAPVSAFGVRPQSVSAITTAEYAALTEFITTAQDRTASRNGASDAVPPENA